MADADFGPYVIGPSWAGLPSIERLVIFGDSYCDVGWPREGYPRPTYEFPLGLPYPGKPHTESHSHPNWVGWLLKSRENEQEMLAYVYAVRGTMVAQLGDQVGQFLRHRANVADWQTFETKEVLFMTWIGISDCAMGPGYAEKLRSLFELQDRLYQAGARNFMFFDVPPIHLGPGVRGRSNYFSRAYENWNTMLNQCARTFSNRHPDATILMFSAWEIFNQIFDAPNAFGLSSSNLHRIGGDVWLDNLHVTSKFHRVLARQIERFLLKAPAFKPVSSEIGDKSSGPSTQVGHAPQL